MARLVTQKLEHEVGVGRHLLQRGELARERHQPLRPLEAEDALRRPRRADRVHGRLGRQAHLQQAVRSAGALRRLDQ